MKRKKTQSSTLSRMFTEEKEYYGKKPISFRNAAKYLDVSESYLYKLTFNRVIPYYKPGGKIIYFRIADLDKWMLSKKIASNEEINEKAKSYIVNYNGEKHD